ncbi:signal recognition particle, SRP9/SRP14 subunit [Fomitiporia mediterranea MF3/22]|uniref:signal recognition particle, SRP9/SRP14 subunit n=1 Tax=Fomitiporia mediterranea (strain MF3/22) TaxID=694068 RepID=UPI0004408640|nr:signal recognition particle, SRP9/SRP14 subunit [Fomitiporia mediterranea MF3/22]EJD04977.1 signal recognition particle, SRP9/SRP14 subunit [Fomitiporia mediterranea MF3/22]
MVYIHSWPEYQSAVEALYEQAPERTRYCVKWKPSEGKLVLKITDDVTCLKYKTHSSIYLNRFEALNYSMMRRMQNVSSSGSPGPGTTTTTTAGKVQERLGGEGEREASRSGTPVPGGIISSGGTGGAGGVGVGVANNNGGVSGGGVKKKKGKKKK